MQQQACSQQHGCHTVTMYTADHRILLLQGAFGCTGRLLRLSLLMYMLMRCQLASKCSMCCPILSALELLFQDF